MRAADAHGCAIEGLASANVGQARSVGVPRMVRRARHRPRAPERAATGPISSKGLAAVERLAAFRDRRRGGGGPCLYPGVLPPPSPLPRCLRGCARCGNGACAGKRRRGRPGRAERDAARAEPHAASIVRAGRGAGAAGIAVAGSPEALAPYEDVPPARGRPRPVPGNMRGRAARGSGVGEPSATDLTNRACGSDASPRDGRDLRLFVVAGEHSGDALGAKLMAALNSNAAAAASAISAWADRQWRRKGWSRSFPSTMWR